MRSGLKSLYFGHITNSYILIVYMLGNELKMVTQKSPVKVGVCIYPTGDDESYCQSGDIVTTNENEVKISMGAGRGQKSYEIDFQVSIYFSKKWKWFSFFIIIIPLINNKYTKLFNYFYTDKQNF